MNFSKVARTLFCIAVFSAAVPVFAYNPIVYADNYYELTSPEMISGASSVTGGGVQDTVSSSIAVNPSLIAGEQRYMMDVDYTALFSSATSLTYGQTLQAGLVIPSRYGVGAVVIQGFLMDGLVGMDYGNSFAARGAYAKDLTDRLYIGIGLYTGYGPEVDWALACDLGFWYMLGKVSFIENARWAVSFTGLGKSFESTQEGLYYGTDKVVGLEAPFTMRVGFAGDFLDYKNFTWGFSTDFSAPSFQNAVFDLGMQFLIYNIVKISTGWEVNVRELISGVPFSTPTAGISVNFNFDTAKKKDSFMAKQGWEQSEMKISSAYRNIETKSSQINVASVGLTVSLGQKDTAAPEIILWEDDEE
ncbi:MAG: hypothetical protein K6G52_03455 [Treponemataceae bacterium]|nr:hypothetical protein [Treponemataceae bacterium]